jgi:predicted transposase YdaD
MTTRPHDALFKSAFEAPGDAAALLRELMPPSLQAVVAWETMDGERGSFVDAMLADRHSDLLLRDARDPVQPLGSFDFWIPSMLELSRTRLDLDRLNVLLTYMFQVIDPMHLEELRAKLRQLGSHAEEVAMTIAEHLHEEGRKKGHEEGHKEGRIATLRNLLIFKFQALGTEDEARLQAATPEVIDRYFQRLLTSDSIADVFKD